MPSCLRWNLLRELTRRTVIDRDLGLTEGGAAYARSEAST